jgi:tetratricopeptide (TPR) repeat protein
MAAVDSLSGRTLALAGHVHGLSFKHLQRLVAAQGGALLRRRTKKTDVLVVCAGAGDRLLDDADRVIADDVAQLISERDFLTLVGLRPPAVVAGELTADRLAALGRMDPDLLPTLRLFDVLEGGPERFGYRDLVAVRQVADLRRRGIPLPRIIDAAAQLRRRGLSLSDTRLEEAPWGALRRVLDGGLATLDGQLEFSSLDEAPGAEDLLDAAERADEAGDPGAAVVLYRTALRADPDNPDACYELGLLLGSQGQVAEGRLWLQRAVLRDPGFADAWFALGYSLERAGSRLDAAEAYRRAIHAAPDYSEPLFNLALLLTKEELYREALPLWQRYTELVPALPASHPARRGLTLCRLADRWGNRAPGQPREVEA